jgi:Flp pilus assembly protein TadD
MVWKHRATRRLPFFTLVLVLAPGCQSLGQQQFAARGGITGAQQADLKIVMGHSLEKGGDLDRAIACYTEAAQKDPTRFDACLRLALLHERQGRLADSRQWYGKALTLQPNNPDVYCNLGYSYYLHGDCVQASQALRHAIQLKADHARAHNNLGLVLARMGQSEEALAEFAKAGCSNIDAHVNLAYCFMVDGNAASARQHYEIALQLDPNSASAKRGLQDLDVMVAHLHTPAGTAAPVIPAGATAPVIQAGATAPVNESPYFASAPPTMEAK